MAYTTLRASFTVETRYAPQAREILEIVLDRLAVKDIPALDLVVNEECADSPNSSGEST